MRLHELRHLSSAYNAIEHRKSRESRNEIRKNARLLAQATRTNSGPSFFKNLPSDLQIKIAALTGDESTHNKAASLAIAGQYVVDESREFMFSCLLMPAENRAERQKVSEVLIAANEGNMHIVAIRRLQKTMVKSTGYYRYIREILSSKSTILFQKTFRQQFSLYLYRIMKEQREHDKQFGLVLSTDTVSAPMNR